MVRADRTSSTPNPEVATGSAADAGLGELMREGVNLWMDFPLVLGRSSSRQIPGARLASPRGLDALPRVDIVYSYAGADGVAVQAFLDAGAEGIVSAGFAPGFSGSAVADTLSTAVTSGVTVVQSTRAGSGRVVKTSRIGELGFIPADNLTPQKARILLMLSLTVTRDPVEIARMFSTY